MIYLSALDMLWKAWARKGGFNGEYDLVLREHKTLPDQTHIAGFDNRPCVPRIVIGR